MSRRRVAVAHVGKPDESAPALEPHELLDLKLRQAATRIAEGFLDFCDLAAEVVESKVYERYGFVEPVRYFEERVGVGYRTVRRWLAVRDGLLRLPEAEQPAARAALAAIGTHKASALAPVLARDPGQWRELVERAQTMTVEAVQAAASDAVGARPRGTGSATAPGARFLAFILNAVPPDERDRVERVIMALLRIGETDNPVAAFMIMVDLAERDLGDQGVAA